MSVLKVWALAVIAIRIDPQLFLLIITLISKANTIESRSYDVISR